jgi:hypothetical protein
VSPQELALALGFALIPLVAIVCAKFVTGAFTARYAACSVLGLSILLAWSLARIEQGSELLGPAALAVVLGCWLITCARQYRQFQGDVEGQTQTFEFLVSNNSGIPIVIASPHLFFVMSHRAAMEGRKPFVYLADVPLAVKYTDTDDVERGLLALRAMAPLDVEDFGHFMASGRSFLLYGFPDPFGWVLPEAIRMGRSISVKALNGEGLLYQIEMKKPLMSLPATR